MELNTTMTLSELTTAIDELKLNLDIFFVLITGMIIMFMQCGFAFLEAGAVRSKNATNILIKNALDASISGIAYWTFGYAFAFGSESNAFIGYWNFSSSWLPETQLAYFFFQYVFAATCSTIVSGALAERCHFGAYLVYCFFLTAFIYPVVTHWAWASGGWLADGIVYDGVRVGFVDFAGSGCVHVVGGTAAMFGALLLGPRIGRFDPVTGEVKPIRGHSVPLAALGGFILVFGFLAFNGGSQASISKPGDGQAVGLAVTNTVIAGSFSAFTSLLVNRFVLFRSQKWSLLFTINGALTGMVAICAGANTLYPWGAAVVGFFSAFAFLMWSTLMLKLKIDDPLDAVAVHMGGGLWGLIATAFLSRDTGIVFKPDWLSGMFLGWQLLGGVAIFLWTGVCCLIMFGLLRLLGVIRVSEEIEERGLDIPKHGEPAYPVEAYGHGWIEKILMQKIESGEISVPDESRKTVYSLDGITTSNDVHMTKYNNHSDDGPRVRNNANHNKGYEVNVTDKGGYENPEVQIMKRSDSYETKDSINTPM